MFDWADSRQCRHRTVAAYFGEQIGECGTACDVCTGEDLLAGAAPVASPQARSGADGSATDSPLFESLRSLRRRLADERGVPAYVVFSDATLAAMAERRPVSEAEMLAIPGVGPVKLERYGEAFLEVLGSEGR